MVFLYNDPFKDAPAKLQEIVQAHHLELTDPSDIILMDYQEASLKEIEQSMKRQHPKVKKVHASYIKFLPEELYHLFQPEMFANNMFVLIMVWF